MNERDETFENYSVETVDKDGLCKLRLLSLLSTEALKENDLS